MAENYVDSYLSCHFSGILDPRFSMLFMRFADFFFSPTLSRTFCGSRTMLFPFLPDLSEIHPYDNKRQPRHMPIAPFVGRYRV